MMVSASGVYITMLTGRRDNPAKAATFTHMPIRLQTCWTRTLRHSVGWAIFPTLLRCLGNY